MNIVAIFAGGRGVRMGSGIPKQFLDINGKPILVHTLELYQYHHEIDKIYIATIGEYIPYVRGLIEDYHLTKVCDVVEGGDTAQDSIYCALRAAISENDPSSVVLIHDGVRPFVSYDVISGNIRMAREEGSAITCTPANETVILSEDGRIVESVPDRKNSYTAQAPQSFLLGEIYDAHNEIRETNEKYKDLVDSCSIYKKLGKKVCMIKGNWGNIKVTTPEDVFMFRALIQYKESEQIFGFGLTDGANSKFASFQHK